MGALRAGGWFVYILRCRDGTFYTGITKDVVRRCRQHNEGTASRYTRSRRPVRLVTCNRARTGVPSARVRSRYTVLGTP